MNLLTAFGSALIGCYASQSAPQTCDTCRGPGEPRIELGTFSDPLDYGRPWMPWVPLPPDRTVYMALTPGDFTAALNVWTSGLCWQESRFEWEVIGCVGGNLGDEDYRVCAGSLPPTTINETFEDGPRQSIWIGAFLCPLTEAMKTAPVEIRITAREIGVERGFGNEVCTEDLRTTTDVFTFVPICLPEDDFCREECFGE